MGGYELLLSSERGPRVKEYTLAALVAVVLAVLWDRAAGTCLLRRPRFWVFLGVIFVFKFLVNGYLTGLPIVVYDPDFFVGIRLGTIPLEDFFFGFSMVTVSLVVWEAMKRQQDKERS